MALLKITARRKKKVCYYRKGTFVIDRNDTGPDTHKIRNAYRHLKPQIKFNDVLDIWLRNNSVRLKGATINKYSYLINSHIRPVLGDKNVSEITASCINEFLLQKLQHGSLKNNEGLSPSYVRSITIIVNSVINFAAREHMCPPLMSPVYKPILMKKESKVLSAEEQRKLEEYAIKTKDHTCIGIFLSLHAGLRIGEVCALSKDDVDLEKAVIHIRHTVARIIDPNDSKRTKLIIDFPKTKASFRDIPIPSVLLEILKNSHLTDYVVSDDNKFFNPRTFEYRFQKILEKCGIERVNYHMLRHTFATRCIEAGVDMKSLSEILGHSSVSVTMGTYVHSSMELKRFQIEKISACSVLNV